VATTTTANAAFITGDSPSRPNPSESGGGLHNFVRFIENWSGQIARLVAVLSSTEGVIMLQSVQSVDPTVTEDSASLFYALDGSNQAP